MTESPNHPHFDDAVLGHSNRDRGLVLGGLEGIKQRLSSSVESDRIEALSQALQYGKEGLNLILETFLNETYTFRQHIKTLLCGYNEPEVKQVLRGLRELKKRLSSPKETIRLEALSEALQYQKVGLFLIIDAFLEDTARVRRKAYELLRESKDPEAQYILQQPLVWLYCKNIFIHSNSLSYQCPSLVISTNGNILAISYFISHTQRELCQSWVELWDLSKDRKIRTLEGFKERVRLTITSDGKTLITSEIETLSSKGHIKVWDTLTGQEVFYTDRRGMLSMTLGIDDRTLAICRFFVRFNGNERLLNEDDRPEEHIGIDILHLQEKKLTSKLSLDAIVSEYHSSSVAISPDANIIIANLKRDRKIRAWDVAHSKKVELYTIEISNIYRVKCLAINPNGLSFMGAIVKSSPQQEDCNSILQDKAIALWQLKTGKYQGLLRGHKSAVTILAFSPDGKILASGSEAPECSVKLWDLNARKEICTITKEQKPIRFITFHQDGKTLYTATDTDVKAWGFQ